MQYRMQQQLRQDLYNDVHEVGGVARRSIGCKGGSKVTRCRPFIPCIRYVNLSATIALDICLLDVLFVVLRPYISGLILYAQLLTVAQYCCFVAPSNRPCATPTQGSPPLKSSGLGYATPCDGPPLHDRS
ncbi:uncharacterized protein EV420DRAFT_801439 [Desarmillaria tabescens]|uniref:Uncharacterized protein n=1 Tax=Armillaria tabescens TaxID=1929756 RepID=A0AA39NHV1_ARMTA|nr:uncharacterized protein EV420DRAFT_801439 [Desarmillaria tabescens]KAK0465922.1 hypothetical protein EV420DRAFT_801439 [Desarmillaria tabescens]